MAAEVVDAVLHANGASGIPDGAASRAALDGLQARPRRHCPGGMNSVVSWSVPLLWVVAVHDTGGSLCVCTVGCCPGGGSGCFRLVRRGIRPCRMRGGFCRSGACASCGSSRFGRRGTRTNCRTAGRVGRALGLTGRRLRGVGVNACRSRCGLGLYGVLSALDRRSHGQRGFGPGLLGTGVHLGRPAVVPSRTGLRLLATGVFCGPGPTRARAAAAVLRSVSARARACAARLRSRSAMARCSAAIFA